MPRAHCGCSAASQPSLEARPRLPGAPPLTTWFLPYLSFSVPKALSLHTYLYPHWILSLILAVVLSTQLLSCALRIRCVFVPRPHTHTQPVWPHSSCFFPTMSTPTPHGSFSSLTNEPPHRALHGVSTVNSYQSRTAYLQICLLVKIYL